MSTITDGRLLTGREKAGRIVRQARKHSRLTQTKLSKRAGVSQPTINRLEKAKGEAESETVEKVSAALGLDANYIWELVSGLNATRQIYPAQEGPADPLGTAPRGFRWVLIPEAA